MTQKTDNTYNLESEQAALAVVLDGRHASAWPELIEIIKTPLAFWKQAHQVVAVACEGLSADGKRIDAMSALEWLQAHTWGEIVDRLRELDGQTTRRPKDTGSEVAYEDSALAAMGGPVALGEIAQAFAVSAGLQARAETIAAHHRQRRGMAIAQKLTDALKAPGGARNGDSLLASSVDALTEIVAPSHSSTSLAQGMDAVLTHHDEIQAGKRSVRSAKWGMPSLDEKLPLDPGTLTTLAAAPGAGKTSLVLHAAEATSRLYGPGSVLMVSREMGLAELSEVLISRHLRLPRQVVKYGRLSGPQRDQARVVQQETEKWNIDVRDTMDCTATEAARWAQARHRITGGKVALLIIDHIGILSDDYQKQTEYDKITKASAMLKALARTLRISVLALCQMTRSGRKAERSKSGQLMPDPEPQLPDLRGSGAIEQDSDGVVFLYRETLGHTQSGARQIVAKIAKNRAGPQGRVPLEFHVAEGQRFTDSDWNSRGPDDEEINGKATRWDRQAEAPTSQEDLFNG